MQAWRQYRAFQPPASVHLANVQGVFNEPADVGNDVEAQREEPLSAVDTSTTPHRVEDTNAPTASPGHTSRAEDRPSPKSGLGSDKTRERSTPVVPSIERTFTAIGDAGDRQDAEEADGSTPSPVTAAPEATVERQHDPSEPTPATTPSRGGSTLVASPIENQEKSPDYVTFEPNDPQNPQNWSRWYKAFVLAQLTFLTLSLTFASAASAPAEAGFMEEFGAGPITATAGTGLFLIGCGLGALPTAPLSELYGRLPVYCITVFFATLFELGCALAPTAPALLVLRFFAGLVSSAPLSNAGGTLFDIGNPISRTIQFPIFASAGFLAPILAPVMGGYVVTNPAYGWRWMYWICTIWNGLAFLLVAFFMPETLAQAILKMKAQRLRKVTGNKGWRSKMEDSKFWPTLVVTLKRPFQMLVQEPVLQFFILYLTVVYIVLYGSFTAYPLIFADHGLSTRRIGLTFIPVGIGFISLVLIASLHFFRYRNLMRDAKRGVQRRGIYDGKVEPEERLVPLMTVNVLFPLGLFWLSWTSPARFNVWKPIISGYPFGIGLLSIFQGSMLYMMDTYGPFAASAISTTTLVRYCVPGLVILAYPQMYDTLGNIWATSLFAFIALALTPVPFLFYIFGRRIRAKCTWTVKT